MDKIERKDDIEVSLNVIVKLTGLSSRRIQQYVNEENLAGKGLSRGKYWLGEFLSALYQLEKSRQKSDEEKTAKQRTEEVKAKTAELDFLVHIRELLPRKYIQETIISELKKIAEQIYAISKRKSIALLQAQNRIEIEGILNGEFDASFFRYAADIKPSKLRKSNSSGSIKRKSAPVKTSNKRRTKTKTKTVNKRLGSKT